MGPLRMCLVTDPEAVEQILVTRNHDVKKSPFYEAMSRVLGQGLLTSVSDDEDHLEDFKDYMP